MALDISAPTRPDGALARLLPAATTLVAMTITILPLPIPGYGALAPALSLMAVYHWTIYRPALLPAPAVFAIGLLQDLLSGALPGVSALVLLGSRAIVLRHRGYFIDRSFPFVWAGFLLLAVAAMLAVWVLHCGIDGVVFDGRVAIFRAALSVLLFPAASFLLGRAQQAAMGTRR